MFYPRQVSFTSGRVSDNGETYETMEARTNIKFRGLNLFELMLFRILRKEVLPKWPNLKRARMVSVNVAVIEKETASL